MWLSIVKLEVADIFIEVKNACRVRVRKTIPDAVRKRDRQGLVSTGSRPGSLERPRTTSPGVNASWSPLCHGSESRARSGFLAGLVGCDQFLRAEHLEVAWRPESVVVMPDRLRDEFQPSHAADHVVADAEGVVVEEEKVGHG